MTISPENLQKIIPSYEKFINFTVNLQSEKAVRAHLRIVFENPPEDVQIFSNHIKWMKKKDGFYYTDMSGQPAWLTLNREPQPVEFALKVKLSEKSLAKVEIIQQGKVTATSRLTLVPLKNAEDLYQIGKKYPAASILFLFTLAALVGGIFIYQWSQTQKKAHRLKMARGRFSVSIPDNGQIFISEKENPFHCRLWGLNKKVRIHYSRAQIILQYMFRNKRFTDVYPVEIKLNRHWTLKLSAEKFEENGNTETALTVLLIPED